MRLVTILPGPGGEAGAPDHRTPDHRVAVVLDGGRLVPLSALALLTPALDANFGRMELADIIARDPDFARIREALDMANRGLLEAAALAPGEFRLAAPISRPAKVIGVGYNYLDHIREQGLERPARPVLFSMFANAVTADGSPIRHPSGTHALDLEAELAVVVGRRASRVRPADGLKHVAGYTAANDVTARDWQGQARALRPGEKGDGQWLRAKGSDTFLPLGPVMVTADEFGDGRGLAVRLDDGAAPGSFDFRAMLHEPGEQCVLGRRYAQPGVAQGEAVLRDLAAAPQTARHLATKLARHFIADDPPPGLIETLQKTFLDTDGDLLQVSKALVTAPESWTPTQAKIKRPSEWMVAWIRAAGFNEGNARRMVPALNALGEPLWRPSAPKGFGDGNDDWLDGLAYRLDISNTIAQNYSDRLDPKAMLETSFGPIASAETRSAISRAETKQQAITLLLMSPEFQRR